MRATSFILAAAIAISTPAALAGEPAASPEGTGPVRTIVIGGKGYPCRVIKHDEKTVTVFLLEAKTAVTMEWEKLSPLEQAWKKDLLADPAAEAPKGETIDGVEVVLKSGAKFRGVELPERSTAELRAFRFKGMPFVTFAPKDIVSVTPIKVVENEIFPPKDRYKRKLATTPPKTAEDYYQLAGWCMENTLFEEAGDNLDKCQLLDENYAEKVKTKKTELATLRSGSVALPPVEKPADPAQLRRAVVGRWFVQVDACLTKCIDGKVSEVPPMPIKVVTLKSGLVIEGALKGGEEADEIQLERDGQTFAIKRELIARMEQRIVEKGPFRARTFAECRAYATDPKGGVTADVLAAVTKDLGVAEKEATEMWTNRLAGVATIDTNGDIKPPDVVVVAQDVRYGVGSWLRGNAGGGGGNNNAGGRNNQPGNRNQNNNNQNSQLPDAETWWKSQPGNIKFQVVKAMWAEALAKVDKVTDENCTECGGKGHVEVMAVGAGGNTGTGNNNNNNNAGGNQTRTCSICRGSGKFYKVTYR